MSCRPSNWALPVLGTFIKSSICDKKRLVWFWMGKKCNAQRGESKAIWSIWRIHKSRIFCENLLMHTRVGMPVSKKRERELVDSWRSSTPQTHFCQCSFFSGKSSAYISTFIISIVVIFIITILIIIINSSSKIYIGSAQIWSNMLQYRFSLEHSQLTRNVSILFLILQHNDNQWPAMMTTNSIPTKPLDEKNQKKSKHQKDKKNKKIKKIKQFKIRSQI